MKKKTALLVGASGLIGGHCLQFLLESKVYDRVTILVRDKLPLENAKLRQLVIDFNRLPEYNGKMAADDVFCCLGSTIKKAGSQKAFRRVDYDYPLELARLTAAQGALQFSIVTAIGSNYRSPFFYSRIKGEVERDVSQTDFRSVNIFRPSLLLGERKEPRPGEAMAGVLTQASAFAMVGPFRKYRPIEARTVALVMVNVAAKGAPAGVNIFESEQIQTLFNA